MEILEFILIVLACVIVSAVLGKLTRHLALPLVQIAVGLVVALVVPTLVDVQVSSELFLVLFIAPLLFNEAREANRRELWENKGAILSLAVGLVLATVLVVGFALNWLVPSIPLAAAFACAAALGPTDAAAVGALSSTISLRKRQSVLLSGESLVNDASGVVSFQFAIAAALTGSFSVVEAGESFLGLFFGGLAVGAAAGGLALLTMLVLRRFGYEDTTIHVLYEVFTPFVVYLLAEWLGVSGILAVVAAGLVMADRAPRLVSTDAARRQMVSDTFWKIIVFLINGAIFVMLGMQLPLAVAPAVAQHFSVPVLLGIVLAVTALLIASRFIWIAVMELLHRDGPAGTRGIRRPKEALRNALVLTLGGPKGAVTLSIVFTIPMTLANGDPFPERSLILSLTAGIILTSLLVANFLLPVVAPKRLASDRAAVQKATVRVLERTVAELQRRLQAGQPPEYIPALRQTEARYQTRLARERAGVDVCGQQIAELSKRVLELQQARADELQTDGSSGLTVADAVPYYAMLRRIRASLGYQGTAANVGARFHSLQGRLRLLWDRVRLRAGELNDEESERIYYDTCLFAIELEHVALDYLRSVEALDDERHRAAEVLVDTHESALNSLWGRINYGQDVQQGEDGFEMGPHRQLPEGMQPMFSEQARKERRYADEVDATALIIELDVIRHLREEGSITESVAHELRQRVYALQMDLEG